MHEITVRYPFFTNSSNFITLCEQTEVAGNMSNNDLTELKRYHESVIYKMKSAIYSLEKINDIIRLGTYLPKITSTTGQGQQPIQQPQEFDDYYVLRLNQDILFYSLIGALDFLSIKINLLFSNPIRQVRDCSFRAINNYFQRRHVVGPISTEVDNIINRPWYQETIPFRNCHTHRYLYDFDVRIRVTPGSPAQAVYFLPDNPLLSPYTFTDNIELTRFCSRIVNSCVRDIDGLYRIIFQETTNHGTIPF